jgi:tripartite-type tricarboxylate transporter receptor subunit TctC
MKTSATFFGLALVLATGTAAFAQDKYPTKVIELIVPFTAGAATDLGGRTLARMLESKWNVPLRVINKPGGNTVPAVSDVARSKPDGYTLLVDGPPQSSMIEIVVKNLPYKVVERTFIAVAAYAPLVFIVPADSPYQTLSEVVADLQKDPASVTWTSLGGAGAPDMTFRQLFKQVGVDVTKTRAVQLKGAAEAVTMAAGGHVKVAAATYAAIAPSLESKKIRALAVASAKRWPGALQIPTTAEAGYPGVEVILWVGISGPPGVPSQVGETWNAALKDFLASDAAKIEFQKVGLAPMYLDAGEMRARVLREQEETQDLFSR